MSKKSKKTELPTNFSIDFDLNFGNRQYNFVNFTTPENEMMDDTQVFGHGITNSNRTRIEQKFDIYNAREFQIDAMIYA